MDQKRLNNKGFTLIEMMVCFVLLGILLVAAAQVIASSTEVYYYSKGTSYGIQASQIVATEIKGDLERAVKKSLNTAYLPNEITNIGDGYAIDPSGKSIYFINIDGEQVSFSYDNGIFKKKTYKAYDSYFELIPTSDSPTVTEYNSKYIGMNYTVKDTLFEEYNPTPSDLSYPLPIGDYKIIKLSLTVNNPQYGDYTCVEYIPLYDYTYN